MRPSHVKRIVRFGNFFVCFSFINRDRNRYLFRCIINTTDRLDNKTIITIFKRVRTWFFLFWRGVIRLIPSGHGGGNRCFCKGRHKDSVGSKISRLPSRQSQMLIIVLYNAGYTRRARTTILYKNIVKTTSRLCFYFVFVHKKKKKNPICIIVI